MIKEPHILVDADACPVKDEVFKVGFRHGLPIVLVANSYLRHPNHPLIKMQMVSDGFDAADDWIAENASNVTIAITADILLADRCVKAAAIVISPTGKPFTENSIGGAVATRAIMADLRAGIEHSTGGPAPFSKADRSRFLQTLDQSATKLTRLHRSAASGN